MKASALWLCAALVVLSGVTQTVHAQEGQRPRGLRGLFYDPDAYARRYSYQLGNFSDFSMNNYSLSPEQLRYLDYLDRVDRAEKFGYPIPVDPYFKTPTAEQAAPSDQTHSEPRFRIFRRWR